MRCFNCGEFRPYVMVRIDPGPYKDEKRLRERKAYVVRSEYPVCLECLVKDYAGVNKKLEGQIVEFVTSHDTEMPR